MPLRPAFTLLELLTVISIISLLIAILMPSLTGARQRSKSTKCQANLREVASATLRYLSDNGDYFPLVGDCTGGQCVYWNGHQYLGWNGRIRNPNGRLWARPINKEFSLDPAPPEGGSAKIAECPSDTGAPAQTGSPDRLFDAYGTSYPLNPILCQGRVSDWHYRNKDLGLSQIIQPSMKVLAADHVAFGLTFDGAWTAIRPGWHDQYKPAAVVAFIDGHADYLSGRGALKEAQWYGDAPGPAFIQQLRQKIEWAILPGSE